MNCDVGNATKGLENELGEATGGWRMNCDVGMRRKGWRMSCDVVEATEELENEL